MVDRLIEHEHLMARLYREMAAKFPGKRQLLEGLCREELMHASLLSTIKEFFPAGIFEESDINMTLAQLEEQVVAIQEVMDRLEGGTLEENELIEKVIDLEISGAELQINRIVTQHKGDPYLKLFAEILAGEEAHNRVLEDWKYETA